jgi:hypothetical protein
MNIEVLKAIWSYLYRLAGQSGYNSVLKPESGIGLDDGSRMKSQLFSRQNP